MDTNSIAASAVSSCLPQIPLFLVWMVGIVLAVTRWQRHPKVSLLALIALVLALLNSTVNGFLGALAPVMLTEQGMTATQIGIIFTIWSFIASIVGTVIWGLVLAAIFRWRDDLVPPVPGGGK
jgi:hypothetical protein